MSEDGIVEPRPGSFSVEPVLRADGALLTWRDGTTTHALEEGALPVPTARRTTRDLELATTAFATGTRDASVVRVRYRLVNRAARRRAVDLYAVVRPVQVNPPWQFLGVPGGAATIRSIAWNGRALVVNDSDTVVPLTGAAIAGAVAFDAGPMLDRLRDGRLPPESSVTDSTGMAEGVLAWRVQLGPRDSADVWLALPAPGARRAINGGSPASVAALDSARALWRRELAPVSLSLPLDGAPLARTVRTALAHVLINARGPAIQPGTRSYRRSWIRDGALTSSALMRLGHADDARAFLDWYVPFVFADGKVPCCVDARGADPVTENDADGELLYLAAEHFRITRDSAVVRRHWATLARVAAHLDSLRISRRSARVSRRRFARGVRPAPALHQPRGLLRQAGLLLLGRLVGRARAGRRRVARARGG